MIDLQAEETKPVNAFLVADLETSSNSKPLAELHGLVTTLGLHDCGQLVLPRRVLTPQYGLGTGKAEEIVFLAKEAEADCIIFDFEIAPTQQRNWEKLASIPVYDRHEVILRIFASRAKTKEAVLQVELAKLNYALPRLAHTYGDMSRQRGGSYGSKGAGETQLEIDRRGIQSKIEQLKGELAKVVKERETNRKRREKIPLPTCALVGYTNAGKSSLLNALTGSGVFVEDKLFATLDPTTRRLSIPGSSGILLTDTVGFISNLPHSLVNAFKSTLEEASRANLLLIVLDASDPSVLDHLETVNKVLAEIGADTQERIMVLNKVDALSKPSENCIEFPLGSANIAFEKLSSQYPESICVSAKTKEGFAELNEKICTSLFGPEENYFLPFDVDEGQSDVNSILAEIRRTGVLGKNEWQEDGVYITARVSKKMAGLLQKI